MKEPVDHILPTWAIPHIPDFQRIARAIQLAGGFILIPVELPGPDLARALARWLDAIGQPVQMLAPSSEQEWKNVAATLLDAKPHADGAVLVIGPREVPPGLLAGLRLLNQRRDSIGRHLGRPLLWCGPKEFLDTTWRAAPDFWSIADVPRRLEALEMVVEPRAVVIDKSMIRAGSPNEYREFYEAAKAQGDPRNAARMGVNLAESLFFHDDYPAAQATASEVLALLQGFEEPSLDAAAHDLLGRVFMARGELNPANTELDIALSGYERAGDRYQQAKTLGAMGAIHEQRGHFVDALGCYGKAYDTFRQLHASSEQASMLVASGRVLAMVEDLVQAEVMSREALAIQRHHGNKVAIAGIYHLLGRIAERRLDFDAAERRYRTALAISENLGDMHHAARTHHQLASIAAERGELSLAEDSYRRAVAINEQIGNALGAANGYLQLGRIALKKHDLDAAQPWYEQALSTFEGVGDKYGIALATQELRSLVRHRSYSEKPEKP